MPPHADRPGRHRSGLLGDRAGSALRHLAVAAALRPVADVVGTVFAVAWMAVSGDTEIVQSSYQAAAAARARERSVRPLPRLGRPDRECCDLRPRPRINPVLPAAFVVGVLAAVLFRRSGPVWPGVVLHRVNNLGVLLVPLLLARAGI